MSELPIAPPKWPRKLLRFFLKEEYIEEVEGDMEELFYDNVEHLSLKKAKRIYTLEMISLLRPILLKNIKHASPLTQYPMFKNYFKITSRVLLKNPVSSFINIFGLAIAIGFCTLIYAFTQWTLTKDEFHKNKNEVYLATHFADMDGTLQQIGSSPRPLAEMLKQDFPEIKKICRIDEGNIVIKYNDNVFHERAQFVDPTYLEMLTFPLKWGTQQSLADINSIIISEEMSVKYFGQENPVGLDVMVIFNEHYSKPFKVTGVAETFPKARAIEFSFLIPYENLHLADPAYNMTDWSTSLQATLIQVDNPSDLHRIEAKMTKYKGLQNETQNDWKISSFAFEPLATLYEKSDNIRNSISGKGYKSNLRSIFFLSFIGTFMLLLACFNYINIAIVSAAKRLKEIGIRKSIGATDGKVTIQFLSENILLTFFAMLLGVALGKFVVIPWFEQLNDFQMEFALLDKNLWLFFSAVLLLTGLMSGLYPAYYISRFQTARIFKGTVQYGKQNPATKVFLGFQLVLACILIVSAVMFTQNSDFIAQQPWGYEPDNTLYVNVHNDFAFEQMKAAMEQNPNVTLIAGADQHIGKNHNTAVIELPERKYEVQELAVGANYMETMGLQFLEGRAFTDHDGSDLQNVVVNELLVKNMAWKNPIGQQFKMDSMTYEVIGVVKNFQSYSFRTQIQPTVLKVARKEDFHFLAAKVQNGTAVETYKSLQAQWAKLFPEIPFQGGHQKDVWGGYFETMKVHGKFWRTIAFVAILLASLGLYGLVTLNISGRIKEFSIRKVLGAEISNITYAILKQYALLFSVALLIGAPISYILTKNLIDLAYIYHVPMNSAGVVVAVTILLLVLLTVVLTQVRRIAKSNPVSGLKTD
ncbi:ABC transporter permease [Chryseolinea lacunae]|uniref:ABC transporter permease n=1 Tax=Chryseolinea lacunae TaxID=2801331 RepID=A0ABS1KPZ9_9BACT|nr:ABC transporter permease [Chryseolinea lacunae]MBL0740361.1 ABC transporter permease [Chryseolinea lacunae]